MNKLKVLSLFSGIGAFEKALKNIGVDYELVNYCEIDKYASKSYSVIHNVSEDLNLGDITNIDINNLPKIDLITHGSPCQDFSIAGKQNGGDEGLETRSSLMWNTVEIIKHSKPKYVVWENVKNVLSKKHKHNFDKYIHDLEELGYISYYKVLNAKDYGIPQNRERIYVISILGEHTPYEFPEPFRLNKSIKDVLETHVDNNFYINYTKPYPIWDFDKDIIGRLDVGSYDLNNRVYGTNSCCFTLRAKKSDQKIFTNENKLRYLTPRECWRLMGFEDSDMDKCVDIGISNNQLYKQAGNSIVVNVLERIFRKLFYKSYKEQTPSQK